MPAQASSTGNVRLRWFEHVRLQSACGVFCPKPHEPLATVDSTDRFSLRGKFASLRDVEIVYEHQDVVCATREKFFIMWWKRTPTILQAQRVYEHLEAAAKSQPGGLVFIVLTGANVSQPDRETGQFFSRRTRLLEKRILAHTFILEGAGLKNTMVRAALHTMQSVSGVIFPWTIAQSAEEGIMFLAKKAAVITEPEALALIDEITKLRTIAAAAQ